MGSCCLVSFHLRFETVVRMDAIRRKMRSMKAEIDDMYKKIGEYEALTKEYNGESDRLDADLRDTGKKVQKFETRMRRLWRSCKRPQPRWRRLRRILKTKM